MLFLLYSFVSFFHVRMIGNCMQVLKRSELNGLPTTVHDGIGIVFCVPCARHGSKLWTTRHYKGIGWYRFYDFSCTSQQSTAQIPKADVRSNNFISIIRMLLDFRCFGHPSASFCFFESVWWTFDQVSSCGWCARGRKLKDLEQPWAGANSASSLEVQLSMAI